jgi:hypothetical protein
VNYFVDYFVDYFVSKPKILSELVRSGSYLLYFYFYNADSTSPLIVTILNCYDVCISEDNHPSFKGVPPGDNKTIPENAEVITNLRFVSGCCTLVVT